MKNEDIQRPQEELELKIGYVFENKELLRTALTHSSYSNEVRGRETAVECNERLEFLGDSILSVIVSDYIYKNYRDFNEGDLTKIRAAVVCENSLAEVASELSLGSYIYLGHGEIVTHGRHRKSIISDATEALLAAIYLDGGIEHAREFILPRLTGGYTELCEKRRRGLQVKAAAYCSADAGGNSRICSRRRGRSGARPRFHNGGAPEQQCTRQGNGTQ